MKPFHKLTPKQKEAVRIAYGGVGGFSRGIAARTLDSLHANGYAVPTPYGMALTQRGGEAYERFIGLRSEPTVEELYAALETAHQEAMISGRRFLALMKALQFYAEANNYGADVFVMGQGWQRAPISDDAGGRARQALADVFAVTAADAVHKKG